MASSIYISMGFIVNELNKFVYDKSLMRTIAIGRALSAPRNRRKRKRINSFPIMVVTVSALHVTDTRIHYYKYP